MAWAKLATDTLTGTNANLTTGTIDGKTFLHIFYHAIPSASLTHNWTFNNDGGSDYATRDSRNGGADNTNVNGTKHNMSPAMPDSTPSFCVMYQINIATEEKLTIGFIVFQNTAGAGTAPQRVELVGKYVETTNQITDMDLTASTSTFATDSNLSAIGTD